MLGFTFCLQHCSDSMQSYRKTGSIRLLCVKSTSVYGELDAAGVSRVTTSPVHIPVSTSADQHTIAYIHMHTYICICTLVYIHLHIYTCIYKKSEYPYVHSIPVSAYFPHLPPGNICTCHPLPSHVYLLDQIRSNEPCHELARFTIQGISMVTS